MHADAEAEHDARGIPLLTQSSNAAWHFGHTAPLVPVLPGGKRSKGVKFSSEPSPTPPHPTMNRPSITRREPATLIALLPVRRPSAVSFSAMNWMRLRDESLNEEG
jgi:hypothetical protein